MGWAIWFKGKALEVSDEVIAQIQAAPTDTMGWCVEELIKALKQHFPIKQTSIKLGDLPVDHPAWGLTPNPWWKFLTDTPLVSWEEAEMLNRQRRPFVVPHYDESGWII